MIYYQDDHVTLHLGDCIDVMRELPAESVDAVCTDPPYGLGFMGKAWDDLPPGVEWARECLRVLKPGGHLLAFGGSRTWHRLAVAVEDAGFEIRDSIAWLYGSGFPKSLDVSKAIDKAAGAEREVVGHVDPAVGGGRSTAKSADGWARPWMEDEEARAKTREITGPATDDAKAWQGWGTALKPAFEPIVMGRKPLAGTVAANVLAHGTGALNIDACRIGYASGADMDQARVPQPTFGVKAEGAGSYDFKAGEGRNGEMFDPSKGRWPANVVLDEQQAAELDQQSGVIVDRNGGRGGWSTDYVGGVARTNTDTAVYRGEGGASRFFYVAKAPAKERPKLDGQGHPTVKPLDLMRWLIRLITPPGGTVLEPFLGSGTTAEACVIEGFRCIAIERDPQYMELAKHRLAKPISPVLDFGVGA